jgi:hypothetical protein
MAGGILGPYFERPKLQRYAEFACVDPRWIVTPAWNHLSGDEMARRFELYYVEPEKPETIH